MLCAFNVFRLKKDTEQFFILNKELRKQIVSPTKNPSCLPSAGDIIHRSSCLLSNRLCLKFKFLPRKQFCWLQQLYQGNNKGIFFIQCMAQHLLVCVYRCCPKLDWFDICDTLGPADEVQECMAWITISSVVASTSSCSSSLDFFLLAGIRLNQHHSPTLWLGNLST